MQSKDVLQIVHRALQQAKPDLAAVTDVQFGTGVDNQPQVVIVTEGTDQVEQQWIIDAESILLVD